MTIGPERSMKLVEKPRQIHKQAVQCNNLINPWRFLLVDNLDPDSRLLTNYEMNP